MARRNGWDPGPVPRGTLHHVYHLHVHAVWFGQELSDEQRQAVSNHISQLLVEGYGAQSASGTLTERKRTHD